MLRQALRGSFAAVFLLSLFALNAPSTARAESGEFNLHIDLGPAFSFTDATTDVIPIGFAGFGSFDWQIASPLALEVIVGGGFVGASDFAGDYVMRGTFHTGAGVRVRILDNQEGYVLNGPPGDIMGNFWVSAHVGFHFFDGPQFGIDAAVGYEISLVDPVQLGVFARGILMILGDNDFQEFNLVLGVNGSFDVGGRAAPVDSDGDTLLDEREIRRWRTNPNDPDTDHDELRDNIEVEHGTDPNNPDTDGDGAQDGREDANHDGDPAGEANPRIPDTDGGCINDGWELDHGTDPTNASDDDADSDRVCDNVDACLGTAAGAEVDERGCQVIRERLVLNGISFEYDSADIMASSEATLQIGLGALRDNPEIRVEIGGHTDNQGSRSYNQELSQRRAQAVFEWLVRNGIDAGRMTVRGYGLTRPIASNDTPEGQAQNRRIEFTVIE
jgi:outer membrane protein OmpA-like peptidoglycan-associated protein